MHTNEHEFIRMTVDLMHLFVSISGWTLVAAVPRGVIRGSLWQRHLELDLRQLLRRFADLAQDTSRLRRLSTTLSLVEINHLGMEGQYSPEPLN